MIIFNCPTFFERMTLQKRKAVPVFLLKFLQTVTKLKGYIENCKPPWVTPSIRRIHQQLEKNALYDDQG